MEPMKTLLAWLLWLWISLVIAGAFLYAPLAKGFIGESSRILFFHVPMAWASFIGFIAAALWSFWYLFGRLPRWRAYGALGIFLLGLVLGKYALPLGIFLARVLVGKDAPPPSPLSYLAAILSIAAFWVVVIWNLRYRQGGRDPKHDRAAAAAIEMGLVFGVLATVTGAIWARIMWGAYWNWDPRQTSLLICLLFYGAYLALRAAIDDRETRGRLSAAYALLGIVVTPFLFWIVPRITYSLHPEPVINTQGKVEMEQRMQHVLYASGIGFAALFFWLHNLRSRAQSLLDRKSAPKE
jgi:heme exporter protein C